MTSAQLLSWLSDHAASLWPILSALLLVALRSRTPEQWVALGETSPRWQGVIRLLRAVGLDPAKALSALGQIVTGRAPARAVQIADTVQRATQAPPPPSDPQRGAVRVGALLAICGGVLLATLAGAVLTGCPRPRDCTPASQRCEGDTPVICDGEGRSWRASGDPIVTCAQVGGVCLVRDGRAFCGRAPADAGAASDGGAL